MSRNKDAHKAMCRNSIKGNINRHKRRKNNAMKAAPKAMREKAEEAMTEKAEEAITE